MVHGSAAVSSAYGDRRTTGLTAVSSVADGRRTLTKNRKPGYKMVK
ncbi:MAG: hypothetical protein HXL35_00815 [Prevotellaceae bacterium]|nr:hypothetical protein [Prevotellaceae bacterium]MBF1061257.1 hypothetical protein [Prevotellaceae bacterium]